MSSEKENISSVSNSDSSDLAKLKCENQLLQEEMQELKEKFQKITTQTTENMTKKTSQIDKMRVQMHRYEFAIKEAVLFLSKPVDEYQDSLNSDEKVADIDMKGIIRREIQSMECLRLSLNYLKSAQAHVNALKQGANLEAIPPIPSLAAIYSNEEKISNSTNVLCVNTSSRDQNNISINSLNAPPGMHSRSNSQLSRKDCNRVAALVLKSANILADGDDSDIGSGGKNHNELDSKKCGNCTRLYLQIDALVENVNSLKQDITSLANQAEEEKRLRERIQLSKNILDQELEELTAQLFDQANHMVIEEAKMRDALETANNELTDEMKKLVKKFEGRGEELKDLKMSLKALEACKTRTYSMTNLIGASPRASETSLERLAQQRRSSAAVDGFLFLEFQDHIKQLLASASLPPAQASAMIMNTSFMKRCLEEDIEPCLFYNYHHLTVAGGATMVKFNGMTQACKKRLMDAVMRELCIIDPTPPEDGLTRPKKLKCTVCTITRDCEFNLKFIQTNTLTVTPGFTPIQSTFPEWHPICRFCKDRVTSTIDFFSFLNGGIKQGMIGPGKQGATLLGIYRQFLTFRRRMSTSRIGSMGLFEDMLRIENLGVSSDWEKHVQIIS